MNRFEQQVYRVTWEAEPAVIETPGGRDAGADFPGFES